MRKTGGSAPSGKTEPLRKSVGSDLPGKTEPPGKSLRSGGDTARKQGGGSAGRTSAKKKMNTAGKGKKADKAYKAMRREKRPGGNAENRPAAVKKPSSRQVWKPGNMLYPLPAVMVSCARAGERPDIVTVAWAGTVCTDPAMVSISLRPSRYSYGIIDETGEFVINLVTEELVRACDFCGVRSGRDTDKFQSTGLTPIAASSLDLAPMIAESPVNIECRVEQKLTPGSHHIFLARVTAVNADESYLDEKGRFDLNRAGLTAYSHGEYYALGRKLGTFGFSVRKK